MWQDGIKVYAAECACPLAEVETPGDNGLCQQKAPIHRLFHHRWVLIYSVPVYALCLVFYLCYLIGGELP